MPISTKMFNEQAIRGIARLTEQANVYQEQVATGKKDMRASQNPVDAARLSSVKAIEADVARYSGNIAAAQTRLSLADGALEAAQSIITRANELAIYAANDTLSQVDRNNLRAEVEQLRQAMMDLANSSDDRGQPLFGGYKIDGAAFGTNADNKVVYNGDTGRTSVMVSDAMSVPTGLNGADVFMRIGSAAGPVSLFEIFEGFSAALESASTTQTEASIGAAGGVRIGIDATRVPQTHEFTLTGPLGSAQVSVEMVNGVPDALAAAINATFEQTGLSASVEAGGAGVIVTGDGSPIGFAQYRIEDLLTARTPLGSKMHLQALDDAGVAVGTEVVLADADQAIASSIEMLRLGGEHIGMQRASVGAYANAANIQADALAKKDLLVKEARSGLEDADLAEIISKLQSLLVNRDAAQQVFAKISQQSLFDYLR